jgi:hypothetical protein
VDFTPNRNSKAVADVVTSVRERDNSWDALVSGGMGMDITYPMDHYYSSIKDLARLLGGPLHRLDLVGA